MLGGTIAGSLLLVIPARAEQLIEQIPGMRDDDSVFSHKKFAFVVDITACIGCGSCCIADKAEYNVPDGNYRNWVERYIIDDQDNAYVDSPDGGLGGYTTPREGLPHPTRDTFFVPKLCSMCEKPSCVHVCSVGATYKTDDGFIFGGIKVNPLWATPLMPVIFLLSACVSGIAGIIFFHMLIKKFTGKHIDVDCIRTSLKFLWGLFLAVPAFATTKASMDAMNEKNRQANVKCVNCHLKENNSLVQQWKNSPHAAARDGSISCYNCHAAQEGDITGYMHEDEFIKTIQTPRDCGFCHEREIKEQQNSHHAAAGRIMASLDNVLGEVVCSMEDKADAVNGCWQCHGSVLAVQTGADGATF